MQTIVSRLALAVAGAAFLAGAFSLPAAADTPHHYYRYHRYHIAHRIHHPVGGDDVTVRTPAPAPVAADPFRGPAAIITGPVAIAGTIVSLPFRFVEAFFPPHSNDPRVVVGAPVHAAGQIAGFPFYVINSSFGAQSYY